MKLRQIFLVGFRRVKAFFKGPKKVPHSSYARQRHLCHKGYLDGPTAQWLAVQMFDWDSGDSWAEYCATWEETEGPRSSGIYSYIWT